MSALLSAQRIALLTDFGYQDAQGQRLQDFPAALRWYEQAVEQYELSLIHISEPTRPY